ncbi:MAG: hypothetical protein AAGK05_13165 [Pseudomonadota bacterium]
MDIYRNFLSIVESFAAISALPVHINYQNLSAEDLFCQEAKWHHSCKLKFSNTRLQRARLSAKRLTHESEYKPNVRSSSKRESMKTELCIFCDEGGSLHEFSTLQSDHHVKKMAQELNDSKLLKKISCGDLIALEAKYHTRCRVAYSNRYRSLMRQRFCESDNDNQVDETPAFFSVTSFIEDKMENGTSMFKLADLHAIYENRLKELNIHKTVNRTRLKKQLSDYFDEATWQSYVRNIFLVFTSTMKNVMRDSLSTERNTFMKTARTIREDVLKNDSNSKEFDGNFSKDCQSVSVPQSMISFVSLLLNGDECHDVQTSQACLTICQLLLHNMKKGKVKETSGPTKSESDESGHSRHSKLREPPLPIYVSLNIHAHTRSKTLIKMLHQLGIGISYNRVLEIEESLAKAV